VTVSSERKRQRDDGIPFAGAAKGKIGVVYMLLKAVKAINKLKYEKLFIQKVRKAVLDLCDWLEEEQHNTMEFCSGLSGTIPLLLAAIEVFKDMKIRLLTLAVKTGEVVWKQGLLLKGKGLCHGMAGNGYFMHSLFRAY
jgi:lantibiotic modifying enzyme